MQNSLDKLAEDYYILWYPAGLPLKVGPHRESSDFPQGGDHILKEAAIMNVVKRRLDALWLNQTRTSSLPGAKADPYPPGMLIRLREPLQTPGKVLPPGDYVIRSPQGRADCTFAQIFNKDGTELVATIRSG